LQAQSRVLAAQLDLLQQNLADCELHSPAAGIVRTRVLEPGEMAAPGKPVVALAILDPKWVRAYVTEPDLGRIWTGMKAKVTVDSYANQEFDAWIGFVSPVAEFTPHAVQTDELRTSLVYRVRVFVKDPRDQLRLGMPATVHLVPGTPAGGGK
jgi:HlyD family secretion protein